MCLKIQIKMRSNNNNGMDNLETRIIQLRVDTKYSRQSHKRSMKILIDLKF
jgi:hypothetical protein